MLAAPAVSHYNETRITPLHLPHFMIMLLYSKRLLSFAVILLIFSSVRSASAQVVLDQVRRDQLPEYFVRLAKAKQPITLPTLIPTIHSRVGDVGTFRRAAGRYTFRCRVMQQIKAGTMFYFEMETVLQNYNAATNEETYRPVTQTHGPHLLMTEQYRSLADGSIFMPDGTWKIAGTYQYESIVGATKTSWRIEPVDLSNVKVPDDGRLLVGDMRKWSDPSGKFTTDAIYLGYDRGTVHLLNSGGKEVDVNLADICESDRRFVREQIAIQKAAAKRPAPNETLPPGHPDRK